MSSASSRGLIDARRLLWVGPATVVASVLAVWLCQELLIAVLPALDSWSGSVLNATEPTTATALLVTAAVVLFPIVVTIADDNSWNPLKTYRRMAFGVLVVSCLPNVIGPMLGGQLADTGMLALATLHVVAWYVTVTMLTRLNVVRQSAEAGHYGMTVRLKPDATGDGRSG
jgi:hypothetical protein